MKYIAIALIFLLSNSIYAAEFIPKKLSQMTDDLGVGTHTADTSDPHGASMTQTNLTVGSLTVTNSLNLGTVTLSGYVKDNGGSATSTQLTSVQINSGTASLSAATIAGVSAPYIAQTGGTGSGLTLSGTNIINGVTAPYPAQSSGTCTGLTANNTKLSGNTAIGTTTAATDVVDIDLGSGNMLIQSNSAYPQTQEIRGGAAADGNLLATKIYQGKDSAGNSTNYAGIYAVSSNVTNGSEIGSIDFYLSDIGSYALRGRWKGANLGIGTSTPQTRLAVNGDISIQSSGYLNFGAGSSSSGYGIRDNAGTMQSKNSAGTWTDIPTATTGGGWTDNGTTITENTVTDQVIIGSTTAASNQILTVAGSQTTTDLNVKNSMSLAFTGTPTIDLAIGDNDTGLEQSSDNVIAMVAGGASTLVLDGATSRVRIGTSTSNTTLQVGGTVTAEGFSGNGAGLTGVTVAFTAVTGSATSSQLPSILELPATTTTSITSSTGGQIKLLKETNTISTSDVWLKCNNPGNTSFVDSSENAYSVSVSGNTIGTTTAKYGSGGGWLDGANDNITVVDNSGLTIGTSGVIGISVYPLSLADAGDDVPIMNQFQNASNYWKIDYPSQGADYKPRFRWVQNGTAIVTLNGVYNMTSTTWNDIKVTKQNGTWTLYQDGLPVRTSATTTAMIDFSAVLSVGTVTDSVPDLNAVVDNIFIDNSNTIYTGTHTAQEFSNSEEYAVYNYQYIAPNTNYALISSYTPGTVSGHASYIFNYATTTAFGYATSTSMSSVGSSNVYSTESLNAELATNFVVKSQKDKKGRNFRDVTEPCLDKVCNTKIISWNPVNNFDMNRLDAEMIAKDIYINGRKDAWIQANELAYLGETISFGTSTVRRKNLVDMERAYREYIEVEWASDLFQYDLINTVEDNAECDLSIRRTGFDYDDPTTPEELKEPKGIGLINAVALDYKAIQEMKAELDKQKKAYRAMMEAIERLGGTVTINP